MSRRPQPRGGGTAAPAVPGGRVTLPAPGTVARPQRLRPGLRRLLDILDHTPALVLGRRTDVVAANPLARALWRDLARLPVRDRNLARYLCLHPGARELFVDWPQAVAEAVGWLHGYAQRQPADPRLADLVAELSAGSAEFCRCWADPQPAGTGRGVRRLRHPVVGELTLDYQSVSFAGDRDQTIVVYTAEPESAAEQALRLLEARIGRAAAPGPRRPRIGAG